MPTRRKALVPEDDGAENCLVGGSGEDTIFGRGGNDTIIGGRSDDELTGDAGEDVFAFGTHLGTDVITDFTDGDDLLYLAGLADGRGASSRLSPLSRRTPTS